MSDARVSPEDSPEPSSGDGNAAREGQASDHAAHDEAFADTSANVSDELTEANQRVLRAQAELENYRKRARRELEDERRYANLPLLQDLLGVLDNLDRAVQHAEQSDQSAGLLAGVQLVSDQLRAILKKHNCVEIKAKDEVFDPNLHESIGNEPRDDRPAGVVTRVTQTGYQLHNRVVRPAQVMVSSAVQ